MPRARSQNNRDRQTAAAEHKQGSGCLSGFMIPPLAVLLISGVLAFLALRQPIPAQALTAPTAAPQVILPTQIAVSPTPFVQNVQPTAQPQVYDGSGQLVVPSAVAPEVAQVYDGSGKLVVPSSVPPEVSQVYDGSGKLVTPMPLAPSQPVVVATPTSVWNFFPNMQAVIVTALASNSNNPAPLASSGNGLAPFFRPEVLHWSDAIVRWSNQAGIDPNLAAVVMQIESCGDPQAVSRSGAIGLFQVMPYHFNSTDNPFDPDTNALRGLGYLARSVQAANGDARSALAGYNGGIGVISRGEWTWPAETQRYIYFGAPMYEDARRGATQSAALDEWYSKYGATLCQRAAAHQ